MWIPPSAPPELAAQFRKCFHCPHRSLRGSRCGLDGRSVDVIVPAGACPLAVGNRRPPRRRPKQPGTLNVGVLNQACYLGGAEIWAATMAHYSRHAWSIWSDIAGGAVIEGIPIVSHGWAQWRDEQDVLLLWCHEAEIIHARIADYRGDVVLLSHGSGEWTRRYMTSCAPLAHTYAAVSTAAVATFPPELQPRVNVILNGVDRRRVVPTMSRSEARRRLQLPPHAIAVGYVGRWSDEKAPAAAAAAVSELPGAIAVYRCPTYELARPELARRLPTERYRLARLNVANVLAAIDVLVLASPAEGCALIVLEALAAGCPVVATRVGGIPDMEQQGPLVVPIPIEASASQLAAAVRDAHARREGLVAAGLRFSERWNAEAMAAAWDDLLQRPGLAVAA